MVPDRQFTATCIRHDIPIKEIIHRIIEDDLRQERNWKYQNILSVGYRFKVTFDYSFFATF